ncbi:MAG: hypothetical protein PHF00_13155, partial [Elusimicrobia bacterium]|nr:hypothetical protein [Elusimicrobiota bacterium]
MSPAAISARGRPPGRRGWGLACALAAVLAGCSERPGPASLAPAPAAQRAARRDEGLVGRLVAILLERDHYARHPIDAATSRRALGIFFDELDPGHMVFDAADVQGFARRFGATLGERLRAADVAPAYEMRERFLARLEQRVALARGLAARRFDFDREETIERDRTRAPWPATEAQVRDIWRKRIKEAVLQERL